MANTKAVYKIVEYKPEYKPYLISSLNNQSNRNINNELIGEPAFNIGKSTG
jgi:hypothetical protein